MVTTGAYIQIAEVPERVRVELDGEVLAESDAALVLREGALPPRYYLPAADVREGLLIRTDTHSRCPYKGRADYWSVRVGGRTHEDLVWSYPDPLPGVEPIAGRLCFYAEHTDLFLDGVPQQRPR